MGDEFINNISRYCIWLTNCPPNLLKTMPMVMKRVEKVREMRLASSDQATNKCADSAYLFQAIRQPNSDFLAIPRVSSERRNFIPIGFLKPDHIAGDKLQTIKN